jgi:acyl dehydratase
VRAGWEELTVGASAQPREYGPLTRTDFVRYQGAAGDFNPIHHDEEFARAAGFPTVFSVGMLQAGILGGFCADWLGADNVRRFAVQFREQVWPGDHLVCEAVVTARHDGGDERTVDLDVLVRRVESGGPAVVGQAKFAVG